jgi:hypothetical protein
MGLDTVKECQRLLDEIKDLKESLKSIDNDDERSRIHTEISNKENRYNQLQCGAIDPSRNPDTIGQ